MKREYVYVHKLIEKWYKNPYRVYTVGTLHYHWNLSHNYLAKEWLWFHVGGWVTCRVKVEAVSLLLCFSSLLSSPPILSSRFRWIHLSGNILVWDVYKDVWSGQAGLPKLLLQLLRLHCESLLEHAHLVRTHRNKLNNTPTTFWWRTSLLVVWLCLR